MEIIFSKYKFTNNFFYKRIDLAKLNRFSDRFEVSILPYFNYSGTYHILSIAKEESSRIIYRTFKGQKEDFDIDFLHPSDEYFISISRDEKKLIIFKADMVGIMLEK